MFALSPANDKSSRRFLGSNALSGGLALEGRMLAESHEGERLRLCAESNDPDSEGATIDPDEVGTASHKKGAMFAFLSE